MSEVGPGPNSHAVLTGPVTGIINMEDGTPVNVTPPVIYFESLEEAQGVAVKISEHYEANGHPDDIEEDEDGNLVQREFVFDRALSNENLVAVTVPESPTEQKG